MRFQLGYGLGHRPKGLNASAGLPVVSGGVFRTPPDGPGRSVPTGTEPIVATATIEGAREPAEVFERWARPRGARAQEHAEAAQSPHPQPGQR